MPRKDNPVIAHSECRGPGCETTVEIKHALDGVGCAYYHCPNCKHFERFSRVATKELLINEDKNHDEEKIKLQSKKVIKAIPVKAALKLEVQPEQAPKMFQSQPEQNPEPIPENPVQIPLTETINLEAPSGTATSDTSHIEDIKIAPEIPLENPGVDISANASGMLTRDQFYGAFESVFAFGGAITKLESLPIQPGEKPSANAAANILYDMALELPWLRFLIEPQNIMLQRVIVVGSFGYMKYAAVKLEIDFRRAERQKEQELVSNAAE